MRRQEYSYWDLEMIDHLASLRYGFISISINFDSLPDNRLVRFNLFIIILIA